MAWRKLNQAFVIAIVLVLPYLVIKHCIFQRSYPSWKRRITSRNVVVPMLLPINNSSEYRRSDTTVDIKKPYFTQTLKRLRIIQQSTTARPALHNTKRSCRPQEVVVFLKTHKTGSSTITNIVNRFADLNNLKIALPTGRYNRFRWPVPFHWSAVDLLRLDGDAPSILSNHARYNRPTMQLIMREGAKYITILRNPVTQYESLFEQMEFNRYIQLNNSKNPLVKFVENPVPPLFKMKDTFHGIPERMNLVRNPMSFDLGLYPPAYYNMTRVREEMAKIHRDFELVLIMEYFDESLILLKKAFCWKFEDIVYVKMNQRTHAPHVRLSNSVKERILAWNSADVVFYDFFNKTLWEKIHNYGPSFLDDLHKFRKLNSYFRDVCVDKGQLVENGANVRLYRLSATVPRYDRYFCKKILRNETEYLEYFREKYRPYRSYQSILESEKRKKRSTRELLERLQSTGYNNQDNIPRTVS